MPTALMHALLALLWLGVGGSERCQRDEDCVENGRCLSAPAVKGQNDSEHVKSCYCPKTCAPSVPLECIRRKQCVVASSPETLDNRCDKQTKFCLCRAPKERKHVCLKKNLKITFLNATRSSVYLGEPFNVTCCVNMEPRSVLLRWFHNGTEKRSDYKPDEFQLCWKLIISAAKFHDGGTYVCSVSTDVHPAPVNASAIVNVRANAYLALKAVVLNSTALKVDWTSNPITESIKLRVESLDGALIFDGKLARKDRPHVITNIKPSSEYSISAQTIVGDGKRPIYRKIIVQTFGEAETAPPDPPRGLSLRIIDEISRTKCRVVWVPPVSPGGSVHYYTVDFYGVIRRQVMHGVRNSGQLHRPKSSNCRNLQHVLPRLESKDNVTFCEFEGLLPNRNYSATVVAVGPFGRSSPATTTTQCLTSFGPPANIESPVAKRGLDDKTIAVEFQSAPDDINGPITCYFLAIVPCTLNVNFSQLPPPGYINFDVYERAMQSNLHIMFQPIFAYIAEAYYELPRRTVIGDGRQVISSDSGALDFLGRFLPQDGELERGYKYIGFLIARVDPDRTVYNLSNGRPDILPSWLQPTYSFSGYFKPVYLGDAEVSITEHQRKNYYETVYLLAVGLSVLIVVAIFSSIGCFYYSHIKGWLKTILCIETNFVSDRNSFTDLQRVTKCRDFQPTSVDDLPAEYLLRHRDSNFLFTVEFESLPHYNFDTVASDLPDNASKNRYNDIKAFDVTRVKLKASSKEGKEECGDYINANYIQGYKGSKLFIAAQGPTLDTVNDFWRLIWEQDIRVVVMVTNLQEKYRTMCIKYWPEHATSTYGKIEVKPVDWSFFSDYVIRGFSIRCLADQPDKANEGEQDVLLKSEPRTVLQYHYTGWYDYRAPEGSFGFLRFMKQFKKLDIARDIPVLVHCSAGVGRTGTFIAVDSLMDQMAEEGCVDVFGFVSNLRRQRNFMVQSLDQYVFIYKALAEWHMFGDTDVEAERIEEHVRELRRQPGDDPTALTEMEKEFNKLLLTLEDQPSSEFAHKEFNEAKSRYRSVVPYDRNRVILAPLFGHEDATYINASFVRGYLCRYILTQDPMKNTVWDFWRMIVDQNVTCIVMLTEESSLEPGEKYWPAELNHGVSFGDKPVLTVQMVQEEHMPNCIFRKFNVSHSKENELRKVGMFSFKDWSNDAPAVPVISGDSDNEKRLTTTVPSLPNSTASLFDLVGKVSQRQLDCVESGPIVIHCRDGSERSGLYCAISLLLERLRREGKVDVFKTVKTLQVQRSHIVSSLAHISLCKRVGNSALQQLRCRGEWCFELSKPSLALVGLHILDSASSTNCCIRFKQKTKRLSPSVWLSLKLTAIVQV
uniref:protein-tyrosine-phosphatase n=1 Tax=Trichuris muris TaxID=70415 RepID=A0A5S6QAE4_TRIMR